jgi:hypothetical protein
VSTGRGLRPLRISRAARAAVFAVVSVGCTSPLLVAEPRDGAAPVAPGSETGVFGDASPGPVDATSEPDPLHDPTDAEVPDGADAGDASDAGDG